MNERRPCAQVVAADGVNLRLLARTCKDYIHKALVEEEAASETNGKSTRVATAAGTVGLALHENGAFATLGKDLPVYVALRVGKFPDTMEALVSRHVEKKDEQSALITCDLYKGTFEGWGRPHWYISQVYTDMGRHEVRERGRRGKGGGVGWGSSRRVRETVRFFIYFFSVDLSLCDE